MTERTDLSALRFDPSPPGSPDSAPGAPVTGPHLNAQKAPVNAPHAIICDHCRRVLIDNGRCVIECECGHSTVITDA